MKNTLFILLFSIPFYGFAQESHLEKCVSALGSKIMHFNKEARVTGLKKRILVFGQIHGDEPQAGELAHHWIKRLERLSPSNHWRIVPLLNPDGTITKTRYNHNGVDLNRNFPTKDWEGNALHHWKTAQKSDKRRYPGPQGGSEPETNCAISHIDDFKPDIIVSIHTPYGLFDFDGPAKSIKTNLLPWKRLGTFPGSLGRYMWDERNVPVLTIELRPNSLERNLKGFIEIQDRLSDLVP